MKARKIIVTKEKLNPNSEYKLREEDLPFEVKRKTRPRIVKRRKEGEEGLEGAYDPEQNIIEIYKGYHDDPLVIEHEVIHYQLKDFRRTVGKSPEQEMAEELQVDLIAFARLGQPEEYENRFNAIKERAFEQLEGWEVHRFTKATRIFGVLEYIVNDYWQWLPDKWKNDWRGFKEAFEKEKQKAIRESDEDLLAVERRQRINPQSFLTPDLGIKQVKQDEAARGIQRHKSVAISGRAPLVKQSKVTPPRPRITPMRPRII